MSPDPTLKNGTFSSCRNSTAIYKNQRSLFHLCSETLPSRLARSHIQKGNPLLTPARGTERSQQRFTTMWKQSKISFKFKRSFIHSHPSICPANIVCWPSLATQSGKESEPWPDLLPQGPGAPGPSEQMQTGHDLILTQKTRQWRQVRKWTSLKGLTLYTGPKSQEERPFQSLPKVEKTEHFMAQPWHSDP